MRSNLCLQISWIPKPLKILTGDCWDIYERKPIISKLNSFHFGALYHSFFFPFLPSPPLYKMRYNLNVPVPQIINTWYFLYLIFSNLMNKKRYLSVVLICTFLLHLHLFTCRSASLFFCFMKCLFVSFACFPTGLYLFSGDIEEIEFNSHPSLVVYCRCIGISSEFVTWLYTLMAGVVNFNELSAFFFMVCSFCIF